MKPPSLVKSAARALRILEYFDDVQREARASEIARRLHYPQSSVTYLLKSLTEMGYLELDRVRHTYRPTPRVALLGSWISGPEVSDGLIIRLMHEITDATGQTIVLAARKGIYAQYIHVIEVENGLPVHVPVGTCRLVVWSAAGFALLSGEGDAVIRSLVMRTNVEVVKLPNKIKPAEVMAHIQTFRRQGHFLSNGLVTPDSAHLSMRLPMTAGQDRALSIGVCGQSDVILRDEAVIVAAMRKAIARQYGNDVIEPGRGRMPDVASGSDQPATMPRAQRTNGRLALGSR